MFSRRQFLQQIGGGFGLAGLQGTLQAETVRQPHFAPKAKHVIFLFLNGGMSQVDTFDPKPALTRHDGPAYAWTENPYGPGKRHAHAFAVGVPAAWPVWDRSQ